MPRAVSDEHLRTLVRARLLTRREADETRVALMSIGHPAPVLSFARRLLLPIACGLWGAAAALAVVALVLKRPADEAGLVAVGVGGLAFLLARVPSARAPAATVVDLLEHLPDQKREPAGAALAAWHPLAIAGALALWVAASAATFAVLESSRLARDLGLALALAGIVIGAVVSRLPRVHRFARHVGLAVGVVGVTAFAGQDPLAVDARLFGVELAFLLGGALLAAFRVRVAMWTFAAFLFGIEALQRSQEETDDLVFIALCAAATLALWGKAVPRAISVTLGALVLAASFIETPQLGGQLGITLGTASSLGVIACALGASLWALRASSWQTRALGAGFIVAVGALFIMAPEWLAVVWIAVLASVARSRELTFLSVLTLGAHLFAKTTARFVDVADLAVPWALAGILLAAVAFTLMRLQPRASDSVRARGSTSAAA